MKAICALALAAVLAVPAVAGAQAASDVYHVHFTKAVPGQAVQLGEELKKPDSTAPMPDHVIVLRHQHGDDWDYAVIQHYGTSATVAPTPMAANPARAMRAWHTDTFASGPSWAEVSKALGVGGGASTAGSIYNVQIWREAPGHRDQLEKVLRQQNANTKVPVSRVIFQHLEGGPWVYLVVDRYNSWQDFGTDQAAPANDAGWGEVRTHATFHHDTLADRISPR